MAELTIEEFKGHPILVLSPESKYPVRLGINKCKVILEHLDEIKEFLGEKQGDSDKPKDDKVPF